MAEWGSVLASGGLLPLIGVYVGYLLSRKQEERRQKRLNIDEGNRALLTAAEECMVLGIKLGELVTSRDIDRRELWLPCRRSVLLLESKVALALNQYIDYGYIVTLKQLREQSWELLTAVDNFCAEPSLLTKEQESLLKSAMTSLEMTGRRIFSAVAEDSKSDVDAVLISDEVIPSDQPGVRDGRVQAYTQMKRTKNKWKRFRN
ncbi:hypothetical protein [Corynebacterium ulceribovis]|uniref:hypothetical protein n=1 Tax=Corynebacterium ulceribovis TaxID=487732 RepID=UPI0003821D3E|nr:hypothetical protein [Corynebacterium ulceribovis]